ncbi:MAG: RNA replicase beta chain [Sanya fiers-like virus 4]|nr:MAG: RNA replicase beta chain [Sanya fiers-like virus 4]UUW21182.1 MAG: RNA replicase beta chain [Sanya fiers-like virus 4]UUW21186.1 MAG: RNA replicase beta chain [Sanya fiers-like virus 4]UUW21190.1 MAG: RNA replicase beta chain [Sanya fiers-like virus 4]
MHKHRKRDKALGSKRRRANANARISGSASSFIHGLASAVCGEERDYFAAQYLKEEYLSKYNSEDVVPAVVRRSAAIDKWLATEKQNAVTNSTLRDRDSGWNILPRVTYASFLKFARRLAADILGPLKDEVVLGSFSGGASTSHRRTSSHPAMKYTVKADTTEAAWPYVDLIHRQAPLLRQYGLFTEYNTVEGAILFTVPKKTDIDRCACKEPTFNMYLQKGAGKYIRRRLRRFGVNLNDQSYNRSLAAQGARDNTLATLDLSSASDTITIEAVKAILPTDWFLYLNDLRSHAVWVDDRYHRTEMFSSMGNGFTFELESLLFYILARTTLYFEGIPGIVSVYGDDIIIPSGGYGMVTWVLQSFGFKVNPDKSFAEGPFRESCGGHYHGVEDVTPFYLKRPATHLTDVIRVANQLRRWALADGCRQYMLPSTYEVWSQLAAMVPKSLWGGSDYSVDTQLVSPGLPKMQLVRISEVKKLPAMGAYAHWQNSSWNRTSDPEPGFEAADTSKQCRRSRVRFGVPYKGPLFHQEL